MVVTLTSSSLELVARQHTTFRKAKMGTKWKMNISIAF